MLYFTYFIVCYTDTWMLSDNSDNRKKRYLPTHHFLRKRSENVLIVWIWMDIAYAFGRRMIFYPRAQGKCWYFFLCSKLGVGKLLFCSSSHFLSLNSQWIFRLCLKSLLFWIYRARNRGDHEEGGPMWNDDSSHAVHLSVTFRSILLLFLVVQQYFVWAGYFYTLYNLPGNCNLCKISFSTKRLIGDRNLRIEWGFSYGRNLWYYVLVTTCCCKTKIM